MIYLYTGTPGSGKSLHAARDIYKKLQAGGNVIGNFPVNLQKIKKMKGKYYYIDNSDISVEFFVRFAELYHDLGKENQTLVVIDECSVLFNPRDFNKPDRMVWLSFFAQHRKYGYNFLLISQMDRQVDRQIRGCIEIEVKHRKANNYNLFWLLPFPLFVAIDTFYAGSNSKADKLNTLFFMYRKKYGADFYNTFMLFDARLTVKSKKIDDLIVSSRLSAGEEPGTGGDPGERLPEHKKNNNLLKLIDKVG